MLPEVRSVWAARARLGEGAVWDAATAALWWVDILNRRVHRFRPDSAEGSFWELPDVVTCVVPETRDTVVVALRHELARLDLRTGRTERLAEIEPDRPRNRMNDGRCDSRGRFWIGSMRGDATGHASLYRFDPDGTLHVMETGLGISNGLGWSPDETTFYLTDTPAKQIFAYRFDVRSGNISERRVFVDLAGSDAAPDGLAVDAEGCVWSAQWGGGCVIRFAPDGHEVARVDVPVKSPTSCAFGGPELSHLYITTASADLSQDEMDRWWQSGDLFCVQTEVRGLPAHRFGG